MCVCVWVYSSAGDGWHTAGVRSKVFKLWEHSNLKKKTICLITTSISVTCADLSILLILLLLHVPFSLHISVFFYLKYTMYIHTWWWNSSTAVSMLTQTICHFLFFSLSLTLSLSWCARWRAVVKQTKTGVSQGTAHSACTLSNFIVPLALDKWYTANTNLWAWR